METIKSKISRYLHELSVVEESIYEIWVESLDVDWGSQEEEMLGIIFDNKEKDVDEIVAIIREKKIDSVLK